MNSNMIITDPYECLGVKKGCTDESVIREAFKRKSIILDPKNNGGLTIVEFYNLNKSYLQVKMYLQQNTRGVAPQITRVNRQEYDQRPTYQELRQPLPVSRQQPPVTRQPPAVSQLPSYSHLTRFNQDKSIKDMFQYKSSCTNYQTLLKECEKVPNEHLFNLDSWDGLDNFNQVAPVLNNGDSLFVNSDDVVDFNYNLPKEYQVSREYSSGLVSDRDVRKFSGSYTQHSGGVGSGEKLSKKEFSSLMGRMENQFMNSLTVESEDQKSIIEKFMSQ